MRARTLRAVAWLAVAWLAVALAGGAASAQSLPPPIFSPSGLKPSTQESTVAVGASLEPGSPAPEVLFLDEISRAGALVAQHGELRDDGRPPDTNAGDAFYSGRLMLRAPEESDRFFRLRAGPLPGERNSSSALLPITNLPLGLGGSDPASLIDLPDGGDRVFSDEVTIGARPGVSPTRVKAIVAQVGRRLGLAGIHIDGYLPRLDAYSVRLGARQSIARLQQVMAAFERNESVAYASLNPFGRDSAQWFLETINVPEMRTDAVRTPFATAIDGDAAIGVAVMDTGVECSVTDLAGRCAPPPQSLPPNCGSYTTSSGSPGSPGHGTKVMELLAGTSGAGAMHDGVEEGVAGDTRLFPFSAGSADGMAAAIDCVANDFPAQSAAEVAHIINISREYGSPNVAMEAAVCKARCRNKLVVAAAGNDGCPTNDTITTYPAWYESNGSCSCPSGMATPPPGERMLTAGGVGPNATNQPIWGASCSATPPIRSKRGELFAPGWGIPTTNNYGNGTSFAAPLISGCAAVLGAVQRALGVPWDASLVEKRLKETASTPSTVMPSASLMNCEAAVRPPYDLAFVLDRSGSMAAPITGNPSITRWNALSAAAGGFANLLTAMPVSGSRFGLTIFATQLESDPITNLQPTTAASNLGTTLSALTPEGASAMGLGLVTGSSELNTTGRPRALVLFTDDEQNQLPLVQSNGCEIGSPATSKTRPDCTQPAQPGDIRIVTVGLGQPSGAYLTTLQKLATENRGTALITQDGAQFTDAVSMATVQDAFAYAIVPALAGSSPQVVTSYAGNLSQSTTFAPFAVNESASRLIVSIALARAFETPDLLARLAGFRIRKDGSDVTQHFQPVTSGSSGGSVILVSKLAEAGIALAGSYEVSVEAPAGSEDVSFRLVPYVDDHHLELGWGVEPAEPRTLQPFYPTLHLRWDEQPITDAHVTARILKPGDDLGDVLAKHPAVVDVSQAPDAGSPGAQKYFHLLATDAQFAAKIRPNPNELPLTHQSDGKYSAPFDPGDVSGIYQILYRVTAQSTEIGSVQREMVQSVYTRFGKIDWRSSFFDASARDGAIQIRLRPRTGYGRFIGPAQGSAFSVAGTAQLREVTDHQDGSYTLTLDGAAADPIAVSVLGEPIYAGPALPALSWPEQIGLAWWLLLLMILIALVVLLIGRVRATP